MKDIFTTINATYMRCDNNETDPAFAELVEKTGKPIEKDIVAKRLQPVSGVALPIREHPSLLVPVVRRRIQDALVARDFNVWYENVDGDEILVGSEYDEEDEDAPFRATDGLDDTDVMVVSWKRSADVSEEIEESAVPAPPTKRAKKQ